MKTMTEKYPQTPRIDPKLFEKTIQWHLISGANEIREKMGLGEKRFRFMSRAYNARGRKHYIYEVLSEIEQVAIALMNTQDTFSEPFNEQLDDEVKERIFRNTLAYIEREQSLHLRRLTEILVELINFSQINTNEYFDHYLLYKELSQALKRSSDFQKYFDCENLNNKTRIDMLRDGLKRSEASIILSRCWYLQGNNPKADGNSSLASFQSYFDKSVPLATKSEKLALGFYYGRAYRDTSQVIHISIGSVKVLRSFDLLKAIRAIIYQLALHCLFRCHKLLKLRARKGLIADLKKSQKLFEPRTKELYEQVTKPNIKKGDFVSVYNSLCEVLAVKKSKFGYRSFKLKFLTEPLIHDIDCYPAFDVTKQFDVKQMRDGVIKLLTIDNLKPIIDSRIVRKNIRKSATGLWEEYISALRNREKMRV